jgi:transcription-repair coupling factor (superfamily II helicase)
MKDDQTELKIQNINCIADSSFIFVHNLLLKSNKNDGFIYIANNKKSLEDTLFNAKFINLKHPLKYINSKHYDANNQMLIKDVDKKLSKSIANLEVFFYNSQFKHYKNSNIIYTDNDSFFNDEYDENLTDIESLVIKNLKFNELIEWLVQFGYERVSICENIGEFAVRGGVIDLIKPKSALDNFLDDSLQFDHSQEVHLEDCGYRFHFFENSIEEVFCFNPTTQLRVAKYENDIAYGIKINPLCFSLQNKVDKSSNEDEQGKNIQNVKNFKNSIFCKNILKNQSHNYTLLFEQFFDYKPKLSFLLNNLSNCKVFYLTL